MTFTAGIMKVLKRYPSIQTTKLDSLMTFRDK